MPGDNKEISKEKIEISVVLPVRNEEEAIEYCINQIHEVFNRNNISGEIIISDSSVDESPAIAQKLGATLVKHNKEGYGNAYLEGFKHIRGRFIFCADADGSYDFNEIPRFIRELQVHGYDFVIGDRFLGEIEKGAMPFVHKYIGNPLLSIIFRIFFRSEVRDVHCGMRAFKSELLYELNLHTTGMEFASEMLVQVIQKGCRVKQLPINYYKRKGISKLHTVRDGWRHLRFMLLYQPLILFFLPGVFLFLAGTAVTAWFVLGNPIVLGVPLFFHPLFASSAAILIGYQLIIFAFFAKTYSLVHLGTHSPRIEKLYRYITLEWALLVGLISIGIGFATFTVILIRWINNDFPAINEVVPSVAALLFIALGVQTVFAAFMMSILTIKHQ